MKIPGGKCGWKDASAFFELEKVRKENGRTQEEEMNGGQKKIIFPLNSLECWFRYMPFRAVVPSGWFFTCLSEVFEKEVSNDLILS